MCWWDVKPYSINQSIDAARTVCLRRSSELHVERRVTLGLVARSVFLPHCNGAAKVDVWTHRQTDTPKYWYTLWFVGRLNLFNTAVTTHQRPIFSSKCTKTVLRADCAGPLVELTALPRPLTGFKGWDPETGKRGYEEEYRTRGEERRKRKKEGWGEGGRGRKEGGPWMMDTRICSTWLRRCYTLFYSVFLSHSPRLTTASRQVKRERERESFIRHSNRNKKTSNGTKVYMRGRLSERA